MHRRNKAAWMLATIVAGAAFAGPARGAEDDTPQRLARFETIIERLMRDLKTPGLSAIVLKDQEVIWERGFGYADVERRIKATPDTPYGLASVTKPLASVVFFRNMDEGLLDLDDKASRYDAFAYRTEYPNADEIRLRHAISHTTLEPAGTIWLYDGNRYSVITKAVKLASGRSFRDQLLNDITAPLGMDRTAPNPGDPELQDRFRAFLLKKGMSTEIRDADGEVYEFPGAFDYNARGYGTAILLFEAMTARALDSTPYGRGLYEHRNEMPVEQKTQDAFDEFWLNTPEQEVYKALAKGYGYDDDRRLSRARYPSYFGGGAGLVSTVRDLAKFDIALDRDELLPPALKELSWTAVTSPTGEAFPYGCGWFVAEYAGKKIVWHGGAWRGMSCMYLKVPEDNLTFIFLSNSKIQSDAFDMARGDSLNSAFGLAFLRLFVYEPACGESGPDINWLSPSETIIEQIDSVENELLADLYRREILNMYGMYQFMRKSEIADRIINDILPRFLEQQKDPYQDAEVVAHISDVGNNHDSTVGFELEETAMLRVYAIGEIDRENAYDFGWIEDASTGERVWSMHSEYWEHAGGAERNRVADTMIRLPAGAYRIGYTSDDSHAFGSWAARPPAHYFWGIRLLEGGER